MKNQIQTIFNNIPDSVALLLLLVLRGLLLLRLLREVNEAPIVSKGVEVGGEGLILTSCLGLEADHL